MEQSVNPSIIHESVIDVRYFELDQHGYVQPVALLNYLQETAGQHALQLGVGVGNLLREGYTWVLSRQHLSMERLPRADEQVRLRTWPALRETIFTVRDFELFDQQGIRIGVATTSWAVLDIKTRRPVRLNDVLPSYQLHGVRALEDPFETLPELHEAASSITLPVLRGDLDINRHVNNTVYAGWGLEAVESELADSCRLASIEIGFRAEAVYGDSIISSCAPMSGDCHCLLHRINRASDGKELARLRTRWVPFDS